MNILPRKTSPLKLRSPTRPTSRMLRGIGVIRFRPFQLGLRSVARWYALDLFYYVFSSFVLLCSGWEIPKRWVRKGDRYWIWWDEWDVYFSNSQCCINATWKCHIYMCCMNCFFYFWFTFAFLSGVFLLSYGCFLLVVSATESMVSVSGQAGIRDCEWNIKND